MTTFNITQTVLETTRSTLNLLLLSHFSNETFVLKETKWSKQFSQCSVKILTTLPLKSTFVEEECYRAFHVQSSLPRVYCPTLLEKSIYWTECLFNNRGWIIKCRLANLWNPAEGRILFVTIASSHLLTQDCTMSEAISFSLFMRWEASTSSGQFSSAMNCWSTVSFQKSSSDARQPSLE